MLEVGAQLVESAAGQVCGLKVGDHVGGGGEVGLVASLGDHDAERNREVALTHAGWPEQNHVASFLDEAERGELRDELAVEGGLKVEVKASQRLVHREVGEAQAAASAACLGRHHLGLEQSLQDLSCGELVLESTVELAAQVLGGGGES